MCYGAGSVRRSPRGGGFIALCALPAEPPAGRGPELVSHVLIVEKASGQLGFPKGGAEDAELIFDCAVRELSLIHI